MIKTEQLNGLWLALNNDTQLRSILLSELRRLYESSLYQEWLLSPLEAFTVPRELASELKTFHQWQLIQEDQLQVKINRLGSKMFITDGAWFQNSWRVFPDPDEGAFILEHLAEIGWNNWADWIVDPAAGSGHAVIAYEGSAKRFYCDANVRALTYASINALINQLPSEKCYPLFNDLQKGFPSILKPDGNTLFIANVPFAPAPDNQSLAVNSGGGEHGATLQIAALDMVKNFFQKHQTPVRVSFLTWTLGSKEKNEWEVPEYCKTLFPQTEITWTIKDHEYDGADLPNPAPLEESFKHLAESQYRSQSDKDLHSQYDQLAHRLHDEGYSHMAYGFLDFELKA